MDTAATAGSARDFLPPRITLASLRQAARTCRGCPLFRRATQTVFGEGRAGARLALVGEQPGNDEDREGRPFVGPAGRILDRALEAAGIARSDTYVTNVVKHFKWEPRGKRRIHKRPGAREIGACLPWLEHEMRVVQPQVLVCLGATAAQALLGRGFRVTAQRGRALATRFGRTVATIHPSSILRLPDAGDRRREMGRLTRDLQVAASLLNGRRPV
jgi:uracil-DNA glycosylase